MELANCTLQQQIERYEKEKVIWSTGGGGGSQLNFG